MIRFIGSLPHDCIVAFSGGVDSVAIADFLIRGKKKVELAFFNHGTTASAAGEEFAQKFANERGVRLHIGRITRSKNASESQEEYWRQQRYQFLFAHTKPVVTAHHLDDAVESWIFNSLHGKPHVIPYSNRNVVRPFLITPKSELISWCQRKNLSWVEDASNADVAYMRNLIRHRIVPESLKVNPGLRTVVKKMYLRNSDETNNS